MSNAADDIISELVKLVAKTVQWNKETFILIYGPESCMTTVQFPG